MVFNDCNVFMRSLIALWLRFRLHMLRFWFVYESFDFELHLWCINTLMFVFTLLYFQMYIYNRLGTKRVWGIPIPGPASI